MGFIKDLGKTVVTTTTIFGAMYAAPVVAEKVHKKIMKETEARSQARKEILGFATLIKSDYSDLKVRNKALITVGDTTFNSKISKIGYELAEIIDDIESGRVCIKSHKNRYIQKLESVSMEILSIEQEMNNRGNAKIIQV